MKTRNHWYLYQPIFRVVIAYPWTFMVLHISFRTLPRQSSASVVIKPRCVDLDVQAKPPFSYCRKVIKRVIKRVDEHEIQTRNLRTGLVQLSILSKDRATQSDPRLSRILFHKIASIHRDLKHRDTLQFLLTIQKLKSHEYFSPP